MNKSNIIIKNHIQQSNFQKNNLKKLLKKYNQFLNEVKSDINNSSKTLNVLNSNFKFNFKLKDLEKFKKYKKISIIGMGGSILGIEAIYHFFKKKIKKEIFFFDDIDQEKILEFKRKQNSNKVLFLIISKSGDTLETLSNTFFLKILKKNSKNIIILSEKKNNILFNLSKKLNLFYIEHNSFIGGRYSVLSEVGIIPAYLMGIDIYKLRSKILFPFSAKYSNILKDGSIKLANIFLSKEIKNLIFLNYSPKLEKFLYWCQQLIAESLGKNNKGLLPVISNVPKDHHSLLQLYLDGPKDKLFIIFSLEENLQDVIKTNNISKEISFLNNKKLSKVKEAQMKALAKAFKKNKISFREFKIKDSKENILGKLFSYFMLETIILAKFLNINPYNQPAVEQIKIYSKNFLHK